MNKIYLAMDNTYSTGLIQQINKVKKSAEVIPLTTSDSVTETIGKDFRLLAIQEEFADIEKWPKEIERFKEVFILTKEDSSISAGGRTYIKISSNMKDFVENIKENLLSNYTLLKSQQQKTESKNSDQHSDERSENNKETPGNETAPVNHVNPVKSEKQEMKNEKQDGQPEIREREKKDKDDLEPNSYPPVNMSPYPSVDDVPREQLALDKKNYDFMISGNDADTSTIGVWSPSVSGTSTFIISFALYISKLLNVGVIEMPNPRMSLYYKLTRYGSLPKDWQSYFELYKNRYDKGENPDKHLWKYKNVRWFPVGPNDSKLIKDEEKGTHHHFDSQYFDHLFEKVKAKNPFVLVDFPSVIDDHSNYVMSKIDQLWIVTDERMGVPESWRDFIHNDIPVKKVGLIFVGERELTKRNSTAQKIATKLEIPLLASLPYLDKQLKDNIHENIPPIQNPKIRKALEPVFHEIAAQLVGEERASITNWKKQFIFTMKSKMKEMNSKKKDIVDSN